MLRDVRSLWAEVRKSARVLVLMDVSGSMASDSGSGGKSKLDLAKSAATTALDQLVDTDQVGFSVFTTDLPTPNTITADLVDVGPLSATRQPITDAIAQLTPMNGTPLYAATQLAAETMNASRDPSLINAVVVLTDGRNEYTDNDLNGLISQLQGQRPGERGPRLHHRLRAGRRPGRRCSRSPRHLRRPPTTPVTRRRSTRSSPTSCPTSDPPCVLHHFTGPVPPEDRARSGPGRSGTPGAWSSPASVPARPGRSAYQ